MTDLNTGPLTKRAYELCRQADSLPYAGLELTALITAMSEFIRMCETHELGAKASIRRWNKQIDDAIEFAKQLPHTSNCKAMRLVMNYGSLIPPQYIVRHEDCNCERGELLGVLGYVEDEGEA